MTTDYGYVLPLEVDPPETVCFTVHVPKDQFHIAAFMGQMWELTRWYNWSKDEAHTAIQVADVWKRIYEQIRRDGCPDCPPLPHGIEQEDFMPLRVDCDCNVWVTCCDGTEMQLASLKQVQQPTQPGPQPQPEPGECSHVDATIQANNALFLPFSVGGGDVVTITNLSGGWYDGGLDGWRCPNGSMYLFGECSAAAGSTHVGDPIPTIPHMSLIAKDSLGNYYDARTTFTINSGVPNGSSLTLFANDSDTSNNAGSASFRAEICKNVHPVGIYYGLYTNIFQVTHDPATITWYPVTLGVPYTVTSPVPADPSHPDNVQAFMDLKFCKYFDSTNYGQNPDYVWYKMTALSVSGASFNSGQIYAYTQGSGCSGAGSNSGGTATPPTIPGNQNLFEIESHTQFVVTFIIEACS